MKIHHLRRISVFMAVFGLAVAITASANGWVLNGCKFYGDSPPIAYKYHAVTSTYENINNDAQYAWDMTSAPGYFYETSGSSNIDVYDFSYSWDAWAKTYGGCSSGGGQLWYNENVDIKYNTRTMNSLSTAERELVGLHELGHAYGLAHSSLGCSNPVVMRSDPTWALDNCSVTGGPHANDVNGVQNVYH